MTATPQQFVSEAGRLMKFHFMQHPNSRADYKAAMEGVALRKMPRATEYDRKKFVNYALKVYDLMNASGLNPNASVADVGASITEGTIKRTPRVDDDGWMNVANISLCN